MARICFTKDTIITYYPEAEREEYNDMPEKERNLDKLFSVDINYCPNSETQRYASMIDRLAKGKTKKIGSISRDVQKRQFCEKVSNIKNYPDSNGGFITDPEILYESGDYSLIREILEVIEDADKLNKGQIKN